MQSLGVGTYHENITFSATGLPNKVVVVTLNVTASRVSLSGNISSCSGLVLAPVANVKLTLTGDAAAALSDNAGKVSLTVASGATDTVTPIKAALAPASAGINTIDVIATQRHFLQVALLSGCQLTAADVNDDGTVNAIDVIAIQRFYLGRTTGTGNVGNYQFTPANRSYTGVVEDQTEQNYDALIFGDVAPSFVEGGDGATANAVDDAPASISGFNTSISTKLNTGTEEVPAPVAAVTLPNIAVDSSRTNFIAAVTTSAIDAESNLVGFQGDFTFDSTVVTFQSEPVQAAGLTSGDWNVSGNILPGTGKIRTLRVSAFSNDLTPLSGLGTLFELRMTRVSKAAQTTQLFWAAPPDHFFFIDADLKTQRPIYTAPGSVTPSAKRK
jgi:Dockerin type I domain